jgi:serine/threonine protein kinase
MPPEWFSGAAATPAFDLYALGALFYFMIHGAPPFDLHEFHAAKNAVSAGPPPPIEGLGADRNRVLLKMLSTRNDERYQSGREFIDAMRSTVSRSWFPWRRLIKAVGALVIAAVILLAVFMALNRDEIHQRLVVTKLLLKSRSTYQNVSNIGILPHFPDKPPAREGKKPLRPEPIHQEERVAEAGPKAALVVSRLVVSRLVVSSQGVIFDSRAFAVRLRR